MSKIHLKTNGSLNTYTCSNPDGNSIDIGNEGKTVRPLESVLMAMAGCSTIDVVMILEKMKQSIVDIEVIVEGKRAEDHPKVYTSITAHYILYGDIKEKKAEQAIQLSVDKYCSVAKMLDKTAHISTSFEIQNKIS